MPPIEPIKISLKTQYIRERTKKVVMIDIETSLIDARVFRTGLQQVNAHQLTSAGRILTVAGGSMYDLMTKGIKGVWGHSNHHFPTTFKNDPLDDTGVLKKVWKILDDCEVMVAHNARFDKDWLLGRFAQKGWPLPSPFETICTYQSLHGLRMDSKKLNELSKTLVGTKKISTDFGLWMRCSDGDVSAFKEMMTYNIGDIYETLYQVYMRTCRYYPDRCVDLSDPDSDAIQCKVTGEGLVTNGTHSNRTTGLEYSRYLNEEYGIHYVDRYTVDSKKAGLGKIKQLRG